MENSIKTTIDTIVEILKQHTDDAVFVKPKYVSYDMPEFEPNLEDMGMDEWSVLYKNTKPYKGPGKPSQHRLEKHEVCADCHSLGIIDTQCKCSYTSYDTVELEFEVCRCCGNIVEDGMPADTPHNTKVLADYEEKRKRELKEYKAKKNL